MTKKEALEGCVAMWEWFAETGSQEKGDWPGWNDKNDHILKDYCGCYACYYVDIKKETCSRGCPVPVLQDYPCGRIGSVYDRWDDEDDIDDRKSLALKIANSAKEAINQL